jgi:hypothetical protein
LTLQDRDPDDEEHDLIIHTKPIEDFEQMMLDGRIRDASTIGAWGMYLMRQRRRGSGVSGQ